MSKDSSLLFVATEAAKLVGCCERTWRSWDALGLIPRPVRIGRSIFWHRQEISQWIEARCPDRKTWDQRDE